MGCIDNNNCQWMPNAITTCLHMVLWNCIGSLAIAICLSIAATDDSILCPAAAFTLVSSSTSIAYVLLHHLISSQQAAGARHKIFSINFRKGTQPALRLVALSCIFWLFTSGWNILIASRQPIYLQKAGNFQQNWASGKTCVVQRIGTALSLVILIVSGILFFLLATDTHSFNSHLLGSTRKCNANDPELAVKNWPGLETPRNVHRNTINSTASQNLPPHTFSPCYLSRANSIASTKASCVGLGIYTPQESIYGSPSYSRLCLVMQKTLYEQTNVNVSSLSLKGFSPPANFLNFPRTPPKAFIPDSALKAIHPPAYHFCHFPSPLRHELSARLVPPSPLSSLRRIQPAHSQTNTLTSLHIQPAESERNSLKSPSDSTEARTSRSTLSIATCTSLSPCATASTDSRGSKIRHKRCSSDVTIPSTLAERRESGETDMAQHLDRDIDHLNLQGLDFIGCGRFYNSFEEMELDLPSPLFMKSEGSVSSSLGYCGPSELTSDRFPRRVDSLDNLKEV